MKTIATINFKGGVGKTTATWALGHVAAMAPNALSLVFDLDAQMSLTQAIALNEDGSPFKNFSDWQDRSVKRKKTIFNALDEFTGHGSFNFAANYDFIYKISDRYHFVPSVEDLYWTELELSDREKVKHFIQRLLEKIQNSSAVPVYDHILFDCPPSFSLLSYSVLSCCKLVLIPINPDFFAAKGLSLLLSSLRMRIEPFPVPKIGVFMNRAKKPGGSSLKRYSNETQRYLDDARDVLYRESNAKGLTVKLFDTAIFDRVGMKRAIQEGLPADLGFSFRTCGKRSKHSFEAAMSEQEIIQELKTLSQKVDRLSFFLESMRAERQSKKPPRASKPKAAPPTPEEILQHQTRFGELYEQWLSGDELGVQESLDKFDVEDLRRFADSNNLNVTSKMSKERVLQLIGARFREKKQLHQVRTPRAQSG